MTQLQKRFAFKDLDAELELARAITGHTARDVFEGVTDSAERKARARIALVIDKLERTAHGETTLGELFESIYGEPVRLPQVAVHTAPATAKRKGKAA